MRLRYFLQQVKLLLVAIILHSSILTLTSRAEGTGEWKLYPCFNSISQIVPAGDKVYVLSNSNLYYYNIKEGSYDIITKAGGLSDVDITHIAWSQSAKALIIVYSDSNLDILYSDGTIVNISDFYNKSMAGGKKINNIYVQGKFAYLSGEFGVMKIDMQEAYICDTYNLQVNIHDVAIIGNNIYALANGSILTANTKYNLVDKSQWSTLTTLGNDGWQNMFYQGGKLIIGEGGNLSTVDLSTLEIKTYILLTYGWISMNEDHLLCGSDDWLYTSDNTLSPKKYSGIGFTCTYMVYDKTNNCYWGNNADGSLVKYSIDDTTVTPQSTGLKPDGPASNYSYRLALQGEKLLVTAGGWGLVTSQRNLPGEVKCYDNGKWSSYESTGDIVSACGRYTDMNAIAVDPRDESHVFVSSFHGLYEFRNGLFVKYYGLNEGMQTYDDNPNKPYHVIATDIKYDSSNNLWIMNSLTTSPLYCLTSDNSLKHLEKVYNENRHFFNDCEGITFIDNDLWFVGSDYLGQGIYRYNIKNDEFSPCYTFYNQDGNKLTFTELYDMTKDKDGNIWIGTDIGPFFITPDDYDDFTLTQYKVPRNDGTNLADYLLTNIPVTKIAVDGANRKWIGTKEGLYVISSDCNTQLYHFTTSNSPLLGDIIFDILIDGTNGRVYIATDGGMCSYKSDVTEGSEDMSSDNVYAYPNPVTPDFTGDITIVGLAASCDVKITSVSGEVVNSGTSNGGTYVWNGRNQEGDKVASGVYLVCATDSEGNKGAVTKIAIVR